MEQRAEQEKAQINNDLVKAYHRAGDSPAEGRVIIVFADKLDENEARRLSSEAKNGHILNMIGQGNEIGELLCEHVPSTTVDAILLTLMQRRQAGPFYGIHQDNSEENSEGGDVADGETQAK